MTTMTKLESVFQPQRVIFKILPFFSEKIPLPGLGVAVAAFLVWHWFAALADKDSGKSYKVLLKHFLQRFQKSG